MRFIATCDGAQLHTPLCVVNDDIIIMSHDIMMTSSLCHVTFAHNLEAELAYSFFLKSSNLIG